MYYVLHVYTTLMSISTLGGVQSQRLADKVRTLLSTPTRSARTFSPLCAQRLVGGSPLVGPTEASHQYAHAHHLHPVVRQYTLWLSPIWSSRTSYADPVSRMPLISFISAAMNNSWTANGALRRLRHGGGIPDARCSFFLLTVKQGQEHLDHLRRHLGVQVAAAPRRARRVVRRVVLVPCDIDD